MPCGIIFNRHKWEYVTPWHRICTKLDCSETQVKRCYGEAGCFWEYLKFNEWIKKVDQYNKKHESYVRERELSKKMASQWIKEKKLNL